MLQHKLFFPPSFAARSYSLVALSVKSTEGLGISPALRSASTPRDARLSNLTIDEAGTSQTFPVLQRSLLPRWEYRGYRST